LSKVFGISLLTFESQIVTNECHDKVKVKFMSGVETDKTKNKQKQKRKQTKKKDA